MCTLACWLNVFPEAPLVVAANRDEALLRPSTGPAVRAGSPPYLAPRDEVAGGTWWAVSRTGLFVALTNRFGKAPDPARRSRGALVEDVVLQGTVPHARVYLDALDPRDYNGFHLFASDGQTAVRAVCDGERIDVVTLEAGFHLVTERSFGAAPVSRDAFARRVLEPAGNAPLDAHALSRLLAAHDADKSADGLCVHLDAQGYGTRSSSVFVLGTRSPTLLWAGGRPCETPFEDRSELLQTLFAGRP